ncbi:mucin-19-like [Physella acuta]|uniref:mucin-19-like n=1 Tax=Physella acuta TaxID=109671 RepID=UPI0027DD21AE|nr:mucin-19-like [Physella acuta]XP_059158257.1 mucin-19-like [Physella acuta]
MSKVEISRVLYCSEGAGLSVVSCPLIRRSRQDKNSLRSSLTLDDISFWPLARAPCVSRDNTSLPYLCPALSLPQQNVNNGALQSRGSRHGCPRPHRHAGNKGTALPPARPPGSMLHLTSPTLQVQSVKSPLKAVLQVSSSAKSVLPVASSAKSVLPVASSAKSVPPVASSAKSVPPVASSAKSVLPVASSAKSVLPVASSAKSVLPVASSAKSVLPVASSAKSVLPVASSAKSVLTLASSAKSELPVSSSTKSVLTLASCTKSVLQEPDHSWPMLPLAGTSGLKPLASKATRAKATRALARPNITGKTAATGTAGLPVAGTAGLPVTRTTWLTVTGTTGLPVAGTAVLPVTGTTGLPVTGTTGLPVAGTTGLPVTGTSGLPVTGTTGLPVAGTTGLPVAGTAGLELDTGQTPMLARHPRKQHKSSASKRRHSESLSGQAFSGQVKKWPTLAGNRSNCSRNSANKRKIKKKLTSSYHRIGSRFKQSRKVNRKTKGNHSAPNLQNEASKMAPLKVTQRYTFPISFTKRVMPFKFCQDLARRCKNRLKTMMTYSSAHSGALVDDEMSDPPGEDWGDSLSQDTASTEEVSDEESYLYAKWAELKTLKPDHLKQKMKIMQPSLAGTARGGKSNTRDKKRRARK